MEARMPSVKSELARLKPLVSSDVLRLIEHQQRAIAEAREALDWYSIRDGESVQEWMARMMTRAFSMAHDALALLSEDAEVRA
jgi:uncharacterized protein Yka (UPF0111/DUF47 family)